MKPIAFYYRAERRQTGEPVLFYQLFHDTRIIHTITLYPEDFGLQPKPLEWRFYGPGVIYMASLILWHAGIAIDHPNRQHLIDHLLEMKPQAFRLNMIELADAIWPRWCIRKYQFLIRQRMHEIRCARIWIRRGTLRLAEYLEDQTNNRKVRK